jgi:hypothetical protein
MKDFEIRFYNNEEGYELGVVLVDMFNGRAWSNIEDAEHRGETTRVNVPSHFSEIEVKELGDIRFGEQGILKELFNLEKL